MKKQLDPIVSKLPHPVIALTTIPVIADLVGALMVDRWVYYCVDDFSKWPGLDHPVLERMERELLKRVDFVVAASESLQAHLGTFGRSSKLLTHGVDLEHWNVGFVESNGRFTLYPELPRPLIVFWGLIDRRLNVEAIQALNTRMTEGTIVMAGPEQDPDPVLRKLSHVAFVGALPYEQLPHLALDAEVLIMPYRVLPVTMAMQPLKLKEYLATNRPVVATDLPATQPWREALDSVQTGEDFAARVLDRIRTGLPREQRLARVPLKDESWAAKADFLRSCLFSDERN